MERSALSHPLTLLLATAAAVASGLLAYNPLQDVDWAAWPVWLKVVWMAGCILAGAMAPMAVIWLLSAVWYFLLERLREVAGAIRGE